MLARSVEGLKGPGLRVRYWVSVGMVHEPAAGWKAPGKQEQSAARGRGMLRWHLAATAAAAMVVVVVHKGELGG